MMSVRSWFAHWQPARTSGRLQRERRRSPRRSRESHFRLAAEVLEVRTLLSAALPYATAANASQLVADIAAANKAGGPNTIILAPTTTFDLTAVNNTTNGANGLPVIGGAKAGGKQGPVNLTVVGDGDTIERSVPAAFRLFDVASGASLTLENMTLQNGRADGAGTAADGGAIFNQGSLILSGVTVGENMAVGEQPSRRVPGPPYNAAGGGIWSNGSLTLENNTVFLLNTAEGGVDGSGPGIPAGSASGGALYVAGGTVSSNGSLFARNEAVLEGQESDTDPSTGYGGAIYVAAGNVSLSNDTVESNTAAVGTALTTNVPLGGGLYVAAGTVTMRSESVFGNFSGLGGGLFIASGATVYLDSFTVANIVDNTVNDIDGTYILLA